MKDKLLTLGGFDRAKAWIEAALQDLQRTLAQHDVHVYRELTGTAAVTANPYTHAKWDVVDENVTEYRDGMIVCIKVPVAGNGTYGTALQINSLGYKPVVYNVNSMVSTRYSVGSVVWAVYNATQTASLYVNSASASTITGCWQVQDYDANTNTIGYQLRTNSSTRPVSSATYRYRLMFSSLDNSKWVPANNSTRTDATSARTVNQEVINPWGRIVYYSTTAAKTAGQSLSATAQWDRYIFNLGYSFNDGSALDLTFPGPVYIRCTPQAGGGAIIDSSIPYTQTLPSLADGKIYIYLGQAYSASEVELTDYHPVFYHDGTKIAMWMGTSDFFDCVMTEENGEWTCDKNWLEIYNAHVNGKQIRLKHDDEIYTPKVIEGTVGYFGYIVVAYDEGTPLISSNAFIFDLNGDAFQVGWSHQVIISASFSFSDKAKLNDIDEGAQVNPTNVSAFINDAGYVLKTAMKGIGMLGANGLYVSDDVTFSQYGASIYSSEFILLCGETRTYSGSNRNVYRLDGSNTGYIFDGDTPTIGKGIYKARVNDTTLELTSYPDASGVTTLINNAISSIVFPTELPATSSSDAGKVLTVNNAGNGVEWQPPQGGGGGLSNYDFTHTANTTASGSTTTVTFAANQRGSAMLTISADLGLTISCNNGGDNYIWITNTGSAEVDVTISAVTKNSTAVSNVYVPSDGITVPAGGVCEIGVIVNSDGAFITSRNDLAL